jgi:hypothetical protein
MSRDIFTIPEVVEAIAVITEEEDGKYMEIPDWSGGVEAWTENAVLLSIEARDDETDRSPYWFPYSQLRKDISETEIYASFWILNEKGL